MTVTAEVERAVMVLRRGGLVAFPTETVYGLGADATDDEALTRVFAVKGRPADHPLIVHLAKASELTRWGSDVPDSAQALAAAFWPGPLTLVVSAGPAVSRVATGGHETVALRVPAHPLALELLEAHGVPIAAPSANRFGRVSPTSAAAVVRDLGGDVDLVLDGGSCAVGVESTIVDCSGPDVRVLRPGAVTTAMVAEVLGGEVGTGGATPAPGTLATHYAPVARVETVDAAAMAERATRAVADRCRVGVLGLAADLDRSLGPDEVVTLGAPRDGVEYARVLYAALREADALGIDLVLAVPPPADGIGVAVADRLRRAAAR